MILNFREELRKINGLFNFCREIDFKSPDVICESSYLARYGNIATIKFWPQDEEYLGIGKRVNKFNMQSRNAYTQEFITLLSCIDINKEFEFLYSTQNTIMRNAQGEILQIENYFDYPPKVISTELTPAVRKIFERAYDTYYTDNLPATLKANPISEELAKALVSAVDKVVENAKINELRSRFKVVKAGDVLDSQDREERD